MLSNTALKRDRRCVDIIGASERGFELDSRSVPRLDISIAVAIEDNFGSVYPKWRSVRILEAMLKPKALLPFQLLKREGDPCEIYQSTSSGK
jgi:hypothetical protein